MSGHHFAIVAPPLPGHWDPLRVLAAKLKARGHRATFVHIADAATMAEGFGFEPVGAASHGAGSLAAYRQVLGRAPRLSGFPVMLRETARMSAMLLRDLPGAVERIGADVVIADETEPAGGLVAVHLGLPWVTSVTGLPLMRDPLVPPPFVGWRYRDDRGGLIRNRRAWRVSDGIMRPIRAVITHKALEWGIDMAAIDRGSRLMQVAQCPPGLDFPRAALPEAFHYCGPFRAAPGAVELPNDRPLVYCSLGSLQGDRPRRFAAMSAACADLGLRAIVAHGGLLAEEDAAGLPGDPLVAPFWPQSAVLPLCTAAILHGGFNTVLDALAAGVPMLVTPLAFEQPGTAARVARTGAGRVIPRHRLTRAGFRDELSQLLADPEARQAARRQADAMARLGGARQAAERIEAVLAGHSAGHPLPSARTSG